MYRLTLRRAPLIAVLLTSGPAVASDHVDGPVALDDPVADITDLYVFPTPGRAGYLSAVLNVYPLVGDRGHFSDRVAYEFLLRRATPRGAGFVISGDERVRCTFDTPHERAAVHRAHCQTSRGTVVDVDVDRIEDAPPSAGMRVFAGRRSDPFFLDTKWFTALTEEGELAGQPGRNGLEHLNVLSIVVELNVEEELALGEGSLIAVVGRTVALDPESEVERQLDRIGRPELTNVLLVARDREDLRPAYNAAPPFAIADEERAIFGDRLRANIDWFDAVDDVRHWPDAKGDALADLLVDDFLIFDTRRECTGTRFLEVERALMEGAPLDGCGGRSLDEDIMDSLYTWLVNRDQGSPLRDGADGPTQPASRTFPYLRPPNEGVVPTVLGFIQRNGARIQAGGRAQRRGIMNFGAVIFAALGLLIAAVYGLRRVIARARGSRLSAHSKARTFVVLGVVFAAASLCLVVSGTPSIGGLLMLVVASALSFVRRAHWRRRGRTQRDGV